MGCCFGWGMYFLCLGADEILPSVLFGVFAPNQVVNEQLKRESSLFGIKEGCGLCNITSSVGRSFFANINNLF